MTRRRDAENQLRAADAELALRVHAAPRWMPDWRALARVEMSVATGFELLGGTRVRSGGLWADLADVRAQCAAVRASWHSAAPSALPRRAATAAAGVHGLARGVDPDRFLGDWVPDFAAGFAPRHWLRWSALVLGGAEFATASAALDASDGVEGREAADRFAEVVDRIAQLSSEGEPGAGLLVWNWTSLDADDDAAPLHALVVDCVGESAPNYLRAAPGCALVAAPPALIALVAATKLDGVEACVASCAPDGYVGVLIEAATHEGKERLLADDALRRARAAASSPTLRMLA